MEPTTSFVAASALRAANTANAWKPFTRKGLASVPLFFAGWFTSELPLHAIGVQAVATGRHVARHGLDSKLSKAGLALNVGSWLALAAMYRQGQKSGELSEEVLSAGLGSSYRPATGPGEPISAKQIALPLTSGRKRLLEADNVDYGDAGRRHRLDVWRRADLPPGAKAPVLLQVHGGGWVVGAKEEQGRPLMTHMCDQGWVCVAINYRLSPRATWPDHIVDVKRAIAWIRENIAAYGGDPDYIAITGGSAGGHLSSLAALSANAPVFQPGFEDVDTTIRAAAPMYGVYDFLNRDGSGREDMKEMLERVVLKTAEHEQPHIWEQASPLTWVHDDAPPFMVTHGTNDGLVPVEQARTFAASLREQSEQPVVYLELPGTQHAFEVFGSARATRVVRSVGNFFQHVYDQHQAEADRGASTTVAP
ncbi:MAG: alpha/beta hydrolase [Acidimicrobiales bacterium]|nr:alpha/beta hydrolase [Acidimicrobiales bacterium]